MPVPPPSSRRVDMALLRPWLQRWQLLADGEPFRTPGSLLMPVLRQQTQAMLKLPFDAEEKFGGLLMRWWDGHGAARVLTSDDASGTLLLERAEDQISLLQMALDGQDDEASRIICTVIATLHAPRHTPLPEGVLLTTWFDALESTADGMGGVLVQSAATARELLSSPRAEDIRILHGDMHHRNVLDFGERGWLAIDPKRLYGERGFEYANLFCNPDLGDLRTPARFARQLDLITAAAALPKRRVLQWILAYAGLSAVWFLEDGNRSDADGDVAVAELAAATLAGIARD